MRMHGEFFVFTQKTVIGASRTHSRAFGCLIPALGKHPAMNLRQIMHSPGELGQAPGALRFAQAMYE